MRSASTVSGPLLSVSTPASQQNRFAAVHLLTGQLLYFIVEGKSKVKEVFSQLTTYMTTQGMQEIELFALAFILDDEYFFADPESKLSKYSPKSWKSSSTFGLDQNGQPLLQLHLRVKFYVDTTKCLRDEITRQHYYLQLRKNMVDRGGNTEDGDQNVLPLVALGLQADLGDHTADTDISSELLEKYLPSKVYKNNEHKVKQTLCTLHKGHKGVSKTRAQTMFVQEAGLIHKSHMYRLRLNKSQLKQTNGRALSKCNSVWLAICTNGVQLFHESLTQALSCLFLWSNICKLCFDRKKFELRPNNADRLVYYTNSDDKSQRLFVLCRETHEFCGKVYPQLLSNTMTVKKAFEGMKWTNKKKSKFMKSTDNDVIKEKKFDKGGCKDSKISTADKDTTCATVKEKVPNGSISSSVELGYSHTAQNSAVSELDYSVQSAQDSSDAYLMYRHPRARAAYVDNSNQSANTSSGVYTCTSYSTASKGMASASYTTENCCSSVDCNDSGGGDYKTAEPLSDATADDQSATAPPDADSVYSPSLPLDTVAASSTCADDIDDAAVSAEDRQISDGVDDCDGIGGSGRNFSENGTDELYDLSAAATSDSSYCGGGGATTATSTSTDAAPKPLPPLSLSSSSSSKCGETGCSGNRCALDGYADGAGGDGGGGRSRSGSVVSNSGSFRGDGSDPSESGRGARLSADELSDLIVGRKTLQTPPRKGFYPSRPTTSSTLDSDSDYVTLPPPMNFLTGAPSLSNLSLANFDCSNGTSAPIPWDVRRSFDLLSNAVKICGVSGAHHVHHPHQCVVNSNNYLDVHKSGNAFYHQIYPAAMAASVTPYTRQPPPPPPPPPRPKRFDQQLEQYQQQLRSDVDFVVYPLQDPAVSRQEYAEAKEIRETKSRVTSKGFKKFFGRITDDSSSKFRTDTRLFLSTPNVAAASAAAVSSPPLLPSSSSSSSSSQHRQFQKQQQQHLHHHHRHHLNQTATQQPPPLPPLPPHLKFGSEHDMLLTAAMAAARAADLAVTVSQQLNERLKTEGRAYSHNDLLQASAAVAPAVPPKVMYRRRPPPPPPPVAELQKPAAVVRPRRATAVDATTSTATASSPATVVLDIESLREKSRNLDLPLISALCNDQTLLKQTNALTSTENKATQTVATATAIPLSSLQANVALLRPQQSAYHPPSPAEKQLLPPVSCTKCTNGTSSFSSPPPPSFLSATALPTVVATAARTTAKSKTNHQVVKTNPNGV